MSCGQPATWLVNSHRGKERLCDACIRNRHRGPDFSLVAPASGTCDCTHQAARVEQDAREQGSNEKRSAA